MNTTLKLIVIHGWGGTMHDAVQALLRIDRFQAAWNNGGFFTDKHVGTVLRRILDQPEPDELCRALQHLIIARFLEADPLPAGANIEQSIPNPLRFSEHRLMQDFGHLGIPAFPDARRRRAAQLRQTGQEQLDIILPILDQLARNQPKTTLLTTEEQARERAFDASKSVFVDDSFVRLLKDIRDMHEVGGDLDTVASAVLYTHALRTQAQRNHQAFEYGVDYRYAFVNYHEGVRHLAEFAPAEVYMADLPIGALPHFADDIHFLAEHNVRFSRYEDHHPYTQEQLDELEKLQADGLLEFFEMAGPLEGRELDEQELRCGTDIVYDNLIANTEADGDGARLLRDTAHSEDFVCGTTTLGSRLTELIKGGLCKVELAQTLADALPNNAIESALARRKWDTLAQQWKQAVRDSEDRLMRTVHRLEFTRPPGSLADLGGKALGPGSDVPHPYRQPDAKTAEASGDKATTSVLVALAPAKTTDQPSINVGKAAEFFQRTFPDADYLLYCYGANLLVARRLNQADLTFNLGRLMPEIGGPGDGGHAGAAVCRPENNPDYPRRLLKNITAQTFGQFVDYLANRLHELGHPLKHSKNISSDNGAGLHDGGRKALLITAAAILLGIALLALEAFRTENIVESNQEYLPQVELNTP